MDDVEQEQAHAERPTAEHGYRLVGLEGRVENRGLLPASGSLASNSEIVIGRSNVNPDTVPTGYGRPR